MFCFVARKLALCDNIKELKQTLSNVGTSGPTSLRCFGTEQAILSGEYITKTLFQHYRAFECLLSDQQNEEHICDVVELMSIHSAGPFKLIFSATGQLAPQRLVCTTPFGRRCTIGVLRKLDDFQAKDTALHHTGTCVHSVTIVLTWHSFCTRVPCFLKQRMVVLLVSAMPVVHPFQPKVA